jgi:hypothetical protein
MIRAILCKLLHVHQVPAGVNPRWSLYWCCARCGARVDGKIGGRHG